VTNGVRLHSHFTFHVSRTPAFASERRFLSWRGLSKREETTDAGAQGGVYDGQIGYGGIR